MRGLGVEATAGDRMIGAVGEVRSMTSTTGALEELTLPAASSELALKE
jgi:hypothetical protein